jgi:hypothetical protein
MANVGVEAAQMASNIGGVGNIALGMWHLIYQARRRRQLVMKAAAAASAKKKWKESSSLKAGGSGRKYRRHEGKKSQISSMVTGAA